MYDKSAELTFFPLIKKHNVVSPFSADIAQVQKKFIDTTPFGLYESTPLPSARTFKIKDDNNEHV